MDLNSLINLRHEIHREPELSGNEISTSKKIIAFVNIFRPDAIIDNLGGHGIAFIFNGIEEGKTLMFRAELDALPITELNDIEYNSINKGVSHKCGHDGHMTILAGLASKLSERIFKGKIILLFQPAEETGAGALAVLSDPKFGKINPDFIFALHNLPGYPSGQIIIKNDIFAAASKGMIIELMGKTAHAAEPELGVNPAYFLPDFIKALSNITANKDFTYFTLATIIHISVGEVAFGTSPGYGKILLTLRAYRNEDMNLLTNSIVNIVEKLTGDSQLTYRINFTEEFPSTINDKSAVDLVKQAANKLSMQIIQIDKPFKWSEDFGYFSSKYKTAFFGIGSGIDHPNLHNSSYDFPDQLIEKGVNIFNQIIKNQSR